jgi:hypothetical protein
MASRSLLRTSFTAARSLSPAPAALLGAAAPPRLPTAFAMASAAPRRALAASSAASSASAASSSSSTSSSSAAPPPPAPSSPAERHSFQAETKQLLHIVANALYTDKHVFIR